MKWSRIIFLNISLIHHLTGFFCMGPGYTSFSRHRRPCRKGYTLSVGGSFCLWFATRCVLV